MFVGVGLLDKKFPVEGQPRFFEDGFEDDLSPVAAGFCLSLQRIGEVAGLFADLLVEVGQVFDLPFERKPLLRLLVVGLLHLFFEYVDLFPQRLQDLIELDFILLGKLLCFFLQEMGLAHV